MDSKSIENRPKNNWKIHTDSYLYFWIDCRQFFKEKMEPEWERILLQVKIVEFMKMQKKPVGFLMILGGRVIGYMAINSRKTINKQS